MWKNVKSIQYTAPGFEPITSQAWVISHNHWTRAPTLSCFVVFVDVVLFFDVSTVVVVFLKVTFRNEFKM